MRISVVIPAHNEEQSIADCLHSLLSQTTRPFEIIVVNNNSTDQTIAIIQRFKSPLIRIVNESKKGITYARTAGFSAAHGDIIARIDADTIARSDWIAQIEQYFKTHPSVVAITGSVGIRELSPRGKFWFRWQTQLSMFIEECYAHTWPMLVGHNMALRRSAWQQVMHDVHLGDNEVNEDVDISFFMHKVGAVARVRNVVVSTNVKDQWFNIKKSARYTRTMKHTMRLHNK